MTISSALYGFGDTGRGRDVAAKAVTSALLAVSRLDGQVNGHPLAPVWTRLDQAIAGAAAEREGGKVDSDLAAILSARLGSRQLPRGHVGLGDLDARATRWATARHRSGAAELRALVSDLAPHRGTPDLVALVEAINIGLTRVSEATWSWRDGDNGPVVEVSSSRGIELADLVLAVPYALRRTGVTRTLLPSLSGRVRLFASEELDPLEQLTRWTETLRTQANDGMARLRLLERYVAEARTAFYSVRRPAALRRLVGVALMSWSVWAARLARLTKVDISSAWRTLEQAAELGLVQAVPGQTRSRGDATLYAVPPWLRLAGLVAAPRGRPRLVSLTPEIGGAGGMLAAMEATDLALAEIDALLARSSAKNG